MTNSTIDYAANVPIAFALVTAAGLATTFGAMMVFCTRFVTQTNLKVLGASLGFSSGVMLLVSFAEILQKSLVAFAECDCLWDGQANEDAAYTASFLCFFGGIAVVYALDLVVHCLSKGRGLHLGHSHDTPKTVNSNNEDDVATSVAFAPATTSPVSTNDNLENGAPPQGKDPEQQQKTEEQEKLVHMGLMTAAAIGLHNFPEGLATFVATLADPKVGAGLAVAIAIHNIPEGLCVSIPIYFATGSRWKAFLIAFFSGITELIGAALGYGFLMAVMGPAAYAVLFGLVAGMMVAIVSKELLPMAHRYDPQDRVVSISLFFGMGVMALSLVLFRV